MPISYQHRPFGSNRINHAWNRCTKAAAAREWGTDSLQTLPERANTRSWRADKTCRALGVCSTTACPSPHRGVRPAARASLELARTAPRRNGSGKL